MFMTFGNAGNSHPEAIIRVVRNDMLHTRASATPEDGKDIKMGTLLREVIIVG